MADSKYLKKTETSVDSSGDSSCDSQFPNDDKDAMMLKKVKCHSNGALSKKLGAYFNDSHFHDVILKLPDREFKAHRLVLCVWSEYFKGKLQGPSRSRAPSTLELDTLTSGECDAFGHALRFMYTGEVAPQDDNVLNICLLAEKFKVKELRHLCEQWITNNVGDHNVIGASARLRDAEKLGLDHVATKCQEIFCHYFTRLPESTWNSLSAGHVEKIMQSSEVVVEDEFHVLQKLETWVKSNGGIEKQKTVLVEKLLPEIRFRFMSAAQLKQVREGAMGDLVKEGLPGVLEDAFEFRAVAGEQSKKEDAEASVSSVHYNSPRLYYDFDFAGIAQSRTSPFKPHRLSSYSSGDSRPVVVFRNDGHSWQDTRNWQFDCKSFQDNNKNEEPWRLKFVLSASDNSIMVNRDYHVAFLIKESTRKNSQLGPIGNPELLVLVGKGTLVKEDDSEHSKKITLITPPIFEKSPKEIDLCFIGNCFSV